MLPSLLFLAAIGSWALPGECSGSVAPEVGRPPAIEQFGQKGEDQRYAEVDLTAQQYHRLKFMLNERTKLDQTVWRKEQLAQLHEKVFVRFWDRLRAATDKFPVMKSLPFETLRIGTAGEGSALENGVRRIALKGPGQTLTHAEWGKLLDEYRLKGYRIVQTEWHHQRFDWSGGRPRSVFNISIHATNADDTEWYDIRGPLHVIWREREGVSVQTQQPPELKTLNALELEIVKRTGPPVFKEAMNRVFDNDAFHHRGVLMSFDLNGDGRSELVHPSSNSVFWYLPGGQFKRTRLLQHPILPIPCGLLADFNGDGRADLLCTAGYPTPWLLMYFADSDGQFNREAVDAVDSPLKKSLASSLINPSVLTAGDIDHDGDLDVWLGQYKNAYSQGSMPTPYYDANDGPPDYLLLNDGTGKFKDATAGSGLTKKRNRRTYGASFIDMDDDDDLDLFVVSDFAGVDVYFNDGEGRFTDVTRQALDIPTNFGMGFTTGDFDLDGRLDFFVTGMASTTVRRLEAMRLKRDDKPDIYRMRWPMGYGNRMYVQRGPGRYRHPPFNDSVARSGWSWGVVNLDFDNDGDRDLYITNGYYSGKSAEDYCSRYWCHDVYTGTSHDDLVTQVLLSISTQWLNSNQISWNGYEKNVLFMNLAGREFVNVAFPMNVALEHDCLNCVTDDFDLDGRPDLALLYADRTGARASLKPQFGIKVLMNKLPNPHNWIGVRLHGRNGVAPYGAKVTVITPLARQVAAVVTGDSWRSQHAPLKHFGLGAARRVDSLEVRWPNGKTSRMEKPAINRYHDMVPPER